MVKFSFRRGGAVDIALSALFDGKSGQPPKQEFAQLYALHCSPFSQVESGKDGVKNEAKNENRLKNDAEDRTAVCTEAKNFKEICMEELQALSKAYLVCVPPDEQKRLFPICQGGFVVDLCADSSLCLIPSDADLRAQEQKQARMKHQAYLADLRKRLEREDHNSVKNSGGGGGGGVANLGGGIKMDAESLSFVSFGVNVIVLMITGFIVCWFAARQYFGAESILPIVFGLVGLLFAMMVEVCLFIIREQKMTQKKVDMSNKEVMTIKAQEAANRSQAEADKIHKMATEYYQQHPNVVSAGGKSINKKPKQTLSKK